MPGLIPICCHPLVASKHPPEDLRGAFKACWSWLTLVESHQEAFSCCSVLHFTKPNTIKFARDALGVEGLASSGTFLRLVAVIPFIYPQLCRGDIGLGVVFIVSTGTTEECTTAFLCWVNVMV